MKKLLLFLAVSFGCAAHAAMRTDDLQISGRTYMGETVIINGATFYHPAPATFPSGLSLGVFSSTNNTVTYHNVVTDPARRGGANVFTSTNSFMYPLIVGTHTSVSTGDLFRIKYGSNDIYKVTLSSTVQRAITTMNVVGFEGGTIEDAGTITTDNTVFDFRTSTVVVPVGYTTTTASGYNLWYSTTTRTLHVGPYAAGLWQVASSVIYATNTVVIGSVPAAIPSDALFGVYGGLNPRFIVSGTSTTIFAVGNMSMAGMSTFTITDASHITTAKRVIGSSTTVSISTHQNNWDLSGNYEHYRSSATAAVNITGLSNVNLDERNLTIFNVGTGTMTFVRQSTSSSATNRFLIPADFSIGEDTSATFKYDTTTQRWRRKQ